ncbi:MAG: hypothetical protein LBV77_02870 [Candidatus Adiutrix intracellularis]|nr:hypothetical protein [Candidatus Adiutrix intracellularis]
MAWYSFPAHIQTKSYTLALLSRTEENVTVRIKNLYLKQTQLSLPKRTTLLRPLNF